MKIDRVKVFLLCAKQGMNFKDLAKKMGISPITLYTITKRKSNRATTFANVANALGCEIKEIVAEE